MASVIIEEQVEVPPNIHSLEDFRRWSRSSEFPERGRIDYIAGTIEVDLSPEEMFSHNATRVVLIGRVGQHVKDADSGEVFTRRTRFSSLMAELSTEPDLLYFSFESLDRGRLHLVPHPHIANDYIEIEGGPDMVAEIVSDSSVGKDTRRLPAAYFAAGVHEYWLVDARGEAIEFAIHRRGESAFEPVALDAESFQSSAVFSRSFRLTRERNRHGHWKYDLLMKE